MATIPSNAPAAAEPAADLAQLAQFVAEQERKPVVIDLSGPTEYGRIATMLVPEGYRLQSLKPLLDEWRTQPVLRAGTTVLNDLASFCAWTVRHLDDGSVVYANDDIKAMSLTAVIDHDLGGGEEPGRRARYGRHRGVYSFPYSREWLEWAEACSGPLSTSDLAEFFERRIADVMPPPYELDGDGNQVFQSQDPEIRKLVMTLGKRFAMPAEIVALSRGIEINAQSKASVQINRDTGEHAIQFSEENGQGTDRVKPPNAFLIAIPVLHNGVPILIAVHLRYRVSGGKVLWLLELHHPERVVEEVFSQALRQVHEETGLVPLRGIAPAAR